MLEKNKLIKECILGIGNKPFLQTLSPKLLTTFIKSFGDKTVNLPLRINYVCNRTDYMPHHYYNGETVFLGLKSKTHPNCLKISKTIINNQYLGRAGFEPA